MGRHPFAHPAHPGCVCSSLRSLPDRVPGRAGSELERRIRLRELALSARVLEPGEGMRIDGVRIVRSDDGRTLRAEGRTATWTVVLENGRIVAEDHDDGR